MKLHNKQAKALFRQNDFLRNMSLSWKTKPNKNGVVYIYTNNELEYILNKSLEEITARDIMREPFLFSMITEGSLMEWIDLHKLDKDVYIEEYRQVEVVMDIVGALDMYFDDDFEITFGDLGSYGEFSKIDKSILGKLYLRGLFVENKKDKTITVKKKSKLKRYTKISIAKELYRLLCNDDTKEEARKYIEEIKAFSAGEKVNMEHNVVVWLMNFVMGLWTQHSDFNCEDLYLDGKLPF